MLEKFEKFIVEHFLFKGTWFYEKLLLVPVIPVCLLGMLAIVLSGANKWVLGIIVFGLLFLECLYTVADKYGEDDIE